MRSAFFHPHLARFSPIHFLTLRAFPSSQTTQTRCWGRLGILFFLLPFLLHCCFHLIFPSYSIFLLLAIPVACLFAPLLQLSICWSLEGAENKLGTAYLVIENSPYASFRPLCCCEGCECAESWEGAPTLNWKIYDTTKAAQEKGSKKKSFNGTRENIENPCSGLRVAGGEQNRIIQKQQRKGKQRDNIGKIFRCHLTASFFNTGGNASIIYLFIWLRCSYFSLFVLKNVFAPLLEEEEEEKKLV